MAELLIIPAIALLGVYTINKQEPQNKKEGFYGDLPNTNMPDKNYPNDYPIQNPNSDTTITSRISNINYYDGGSVYTDKYFNEENHSPPLGGDKKYQSLNGKQDLSYFTHNNMTPFFGSKSRDTHVSNNVNEGLLDNMNGQGSQVISKREVAPLFDTKENMNWSHGMPNTNEFIRSRINSGNYISNVQPFAQEKVGPGIGMGAGTEGVGGFNSGLFGREQWIDKSVDELRTANNTKAGGLSLLGFEGTPSSYVKNLGSIGVVEKNRPETSFEMGMDRTIGAMSSVKGNSIHGEVIERFVNRADTQGEYTGIAGPTASNNATTLVDGEYMPSNRIELGALPLGTANGTHSYHLSNVADFGLKSVVAYPNNRSTNYNEDYFGVVSSTIGSILSPIMDVLKPNRKDNIIGTLRPYQNPSAKVKNSYIMNPKDITPPTYREMNEQGRNLWMVNSTQFQNGAGYISNMPNETHNQRDFTTPNSSYIGGASATEGARNHRNYSGEYNQSFNGLKEATIKNSGYFPNGNMSLFNSEMNVSTNGNRENLTMMSADYQNAPKSFNGYTPSVELIGRSLGGNYLYDGIQLDRNTPDVMADILKQNPYAINIAKSQI